MRVVKKLTVSSLKESYFFLTSFSHHFPLHPFKELVVKGLLFSCSCSFACCVIKSSLYHIKRHVREEHKALVGNTSPLDNFYKVILKGQSMEESLPLMPVPFFGEKRKISWAGASVRAGFR